MNDQLISFFLAHLGVPDVAERAEEIIAAHGGDSPHLRLTATVIAGYQVLLRSVPRDEALRRVAAAFHEPIRPFVHDGTREMLDSADDPFTAMVDTSKDREDNYFGADFTFVRSADDGRSYLVDVHRCFYWDLLRANDVPELGPVFCEFDAAWIGAIDPDRHGFTFSRPTTLARGGATCPFHFYRS
ncbi:hypothetical protein FKR81_15875 [Lentzea tibetensis]|uniref:L-2-amino-thiazoline-4-carboxylic acid hydrolase n=1 Tax=Lentzea tibetensis TaxID=2591470 RepID=A0A563EU96_9PSEU|nr:L-2-amino-thiazoline-4-carboxylic acid hydrolase [Lentzea tibetensis]TWP51108.1 hypothetical protein FKR81_15875 [Lentzea tibetensis]